MSDSGKERLLDSLGWKMLIELQKDARISFAELGRRVGLSTPAVAQRVRRMEDEGIIRAYRAEISPSHVGLPITAFIRMSIVGDVLAKLTAQVRSMPEIVECYRGTGADSFIMKVNVVSVEHLNARHRPPDALRNHIYLAGAEFHCGEESAGTGESLLASLTEGYSGTRTARRAARSFRRVSREPS